MRYAPSLERSPIPGNPPLRGSHAPYDDHYRVDKYGNLIGGHGTSMAGLVGGNDNDIGYVGIMPEGYTYSSKIAFNSYVDGRHCGFWPWNDATFCIETDDFVHGIDYASRYGFDAISMSFTGALGSSVHSALEAAYYTYDVLPLAALGNNDGDSSDLVKRSYVMGVAGVTASGSYAFEVNLAYREISGYAGGYTTRAHCYSKYEYCTLDYNNLYKFSGGTSAATANVAGIVGLIRAYDPMLSASQARQRLKATAWGTTDVADAYAAILNIQPLSVYIWGPGYIDTEGPYEWEAIPEHGTGSYSYQWSVYWHNWGTWQTLGTGKKQTLNVTAADGSFDLKVDVVSGTESASDTHAVTNATGCGEQITC